MLAHVDLRKAALAYLGSNNELTDRTIASPGPSRGRC